MSNVADVVVVGSGPAGAQAARVLVELGLTVNLVHVGRDDDRYRQLIPDEPFATIRATDSQQHRYFLGDDGEGVPTGSVRIGSQLTPPRQFAARDADTQLPVASDSFEPMQSLALGGLGAAWGAAAYTYTACELAEMGLPEGEMQQEYDAVSRDIGVSGCNDDDTGPFVAGQLSTLQPPLEIDDPHRALLSAYNRMKGQRGLDARLTLGRIPLAILSQDKDGRRANPYFDMDFWSDSRQSIYRPRYTIAGLRQHANFCTTDGVLAVRFAEDATGVTLTGIRPDHGGGVVRVRGKRLMLCAGAINSARLVLASRDDTTTRLPLLCNPYTYMPCLQLRMLGRAARDRRHSMAQLQGVYRAGKDDTAALSLQFYAYRSLLNFKLVKELPLPAWAGAQAVRLLQNALVIVGVHHADAPQTNNWIALAGLPTNRPAPLRAQYAPDADKRQRQDAREREVMASLRSLGCWPTQRLHPGHAASIHYAGTLPILGEASAHQTGCTPEGRLLGTARVFVGDSSPWRFLPAKGPTLSIMAWARRVARHLAESLRGDRGEL